MATTSKTQWILGKNSRKNKVIEFVPDLNDFGHTTVQVIHDNGSKTIIGHVYGEIEKDTTRFYCTDTKHQAIFTSTDDFNEVEENFTRYARSLSLRRKTPENKKELTNHYSLTKSKTTMKTTKLPNQVMPKNPNQLIFVEFEKIGGDGQTGIVLDSYNNPIAYTHRSYNEETQRYENHAYDVNGNLMMTKDKSYEIKNALIDNREQLLEQAHQRRIASNTKAKQTPDQAQPIVKEEERKNEFGKLRQDDKSPERQFTKENSPETGKQSRQEKREQELENLREDNRDDLGEMDIER